MERAFTTGMDATATEEKRMTEKVKFPKEMESMLNSEQLKISRELLIRVVDAIDALCASPQFRSDPVAQMQACIRVINATTARCAAKLEMYNGLDPKTTGGHQTGIVVYEHMIGIMESGMLLHEKKGQTVQ